MHVYSEYNELLINLDTTQTKDNCLQLLIKDNNHLDLCHNYFNTQSVELLIKNSECAIFHISKSHPENILAFALLKHTKPHLMEIVLLCAVKNKGQDETTMIQSVLQYAIKNHCNAVYAMPKAPSLRNSYINFGFRHYLGAKGFNEILKKKMHTNKTVRKARLRYKTKKNTDDNFEQPYATRNFPYFT